MKWNCVNSKENIPGQIKSDEQKPRETYHISIYIYLDKYYEIKGADEEFHKLPTNWCTCVCIPISNLFASF